MESLAITICATASYQYALLAQARHIQAALADFAGFAHLILVTDQKPVAGILEAYKELFAHRVRVHHIPLGVADGQTNYKEGAQLTIAQMRTVAFNECRALGVGYVWSLDSDVLPPANALRCMRQMLEFDGGYYGVATCPYPSQGGGNQFLFGRGTVYNQIAEDVIEKERVIPDSLKAELKAHRAKRNKKGKQSEAWLKEMQRLIEEVKKCPPSGNVWELNAKHGWRKRGWSEYAYPAIGKGAIVPSDWCGMGCTLLGPQALQFADFTGYEGKGTEDLFLVWRCWYPHGIRIAAIPHCVCHHVVRTPKGYSLSYAYHETEGECAGHLRTRLLPWYSHTEGF